MKRFIVNLLPGFLVRYFAKPYVSGNSIEKGIATADELFNSRGIYSTLDLLAEAVTNLEDVNKTVDIYLELLEKVKGKAYISVSLKPTSLGIHESYEVCFDKLDQILIIADAQNTLVTLDMEDHTYTDVTIKLYQNLKTLHPTFGTVLQSRLFRTDNDIDELLSTPGRIRSCIGIYNESKEIALTNKSEMKTKLIEQTEKMVENQFFVEVATHDEDTIQSVLDLASAKNWDDSNIEFQQLMGVPIKEIQDKIMANGFRVRLYVPFAVDWDYATPYLRRRLSNNPRMAIYVIKHLFRRG